MSIINGIDKTFESRVRLGIMSVLVVNDWVDFNELKKLLQVTDGNLASHISGLKKVKYIDVRKQFVANKPNTSFSVTATGRKAFKVHLDALEKLINSNNNEY